MTSALVKRSPALASGLRQLEWQTQFLAHNGPEQRGENPELRSLWDNRTERRWIPLPNENEDGHVLSPAMRALDG